MLEFACLPFLLLLVLELSVGDCCLFTAWSSQPAGKQPAYGSAANDFGAHWLLRRPVAGIRAAGTRLGRLAGINDGSITITYDHGLALEFRQLPARSQPAEKLGDRIAVQVVGTIARLSHGGL
jgi:hypothetical protein